MADDVVEFVMAKVKCATAFPNQVEGGSTQIYYDARILGDDFDDLIDAIIERFGTEFSAMDASRYVPGEGAGLRQLPELFGKRPWRSLTIDDLVKAIRAGFWAQPKVW
jgi:hypothetical protein